MATEDLSAPSTSEPGVADLVPMPYGHPSLRRAQMVTHAYALLAPGRALLVDAVDPHVVPQVDELRRSGIRLAGLLLTHRHVVPAGRTRELSQEWDIPVYLHPADALHLQSRGAGLEYQDPMAAGFDEDFGAEVIHFPGHTEGHVMLYRAHDGLLVTGDSAMGPTAPQALRGIARVIRPPASFSASDAHIRAGWERFDRRVVSLAPYHGEMFLDREADMPSIMAPLRRETPTHGYED